jgi:hypothetical protein
LSDVLPPCRLAKNQLDGRRPRGKKRDELVGDALPLPNRFMIQCPAVGVAHPSNEESNDLGPIPREISRTAFSAALKTIAQAISA